MAGRGALGDRCLDWMMRKLDELRAETLAEARGDVLEVGFGTGLNLPHYPPALSRLVAVDPHRIEGLSALDDRLRRAPFPVERHALRADGDLPFDDACFDTVVITWTLCSIRQPLRALAEMHRVLSPRGRLLFIEHGRAPNPHTARWQDRLNPFWCRFSGGCNMNRAIDRLVQEGGFSIERLQRLRPAGPGLLTHMVRGAATRVRRSTSAAPTGHVTFGPPAR